LYEVRPIWVDRKFAIFGAIDSPKTEKFVVSDY
jgi:hypothetical protein